jgi:hypothetical protein
VDKVSPEVIYETSIIKGGIRSSATLTGVTPDFFKVYNIELQRGSMFTEMLFVSSVRKSLRSFFRMNILLANTLNVEAFGLK